MVDASRQIVAGDIATASGVIVVGQSATALALTGSTTLTLLATVVIPANSIGPNGQVDVETLWSCTNSANNKTFQIRFGGSNILNIVLTATASMQHHCRVANRGAASQVSYATNSNSGYGQGTGAINTLAKDTTQDVVVELYGQLANSAETITLESYRVLVSKGG